MNLKLLAIVSIALLVLSTGVVAAQAGPPDDVPGPVPDFVSDILGSISAFLSNVLGAVGDLVDRVTPGAVVWVPA